MAEGAGIPALAERGSVTGPGWGTAARVCLDVYAPRTGRLCRAVFIRAAVPAATGSATQPGPACENPH